MLWNLHLFRKTKMILIIIFRKNIKVIINQVNINNKMISYRLTIDINKMLLKKIKIIIKTNKFKVKNNNNNNSYLSTKMKKKDR